MTLLQQFVIKCAKADDQALLVFIDLLQKYIEVELNRELDMFEVSHTMFTISLNTELDAFRKRGSSDYQAHAVDQLDTMRTKQN